LIIIFSVQRYSHVIIITALQEEIPFVKTAPIEEVDTKKGKKQAGKVKQSGEE
jgi:hypothetical protein